VPFSQVSLVVERARAVATVQKQAIRRAIKKAFANGCTAEQLENVIVPIMDAYEGVRARDADRGKSEHAYDLQSKKRVFADTRKIDGVEQKVDCITWDLPIEQTLQRQLYLQPDFARHLRDWGDLPLADNGELADVQDGAAAKEHPMLGEMNWCGANRLGFGWYVDDIDVVCPIGTARGRHKVTLQFCTVLNQPLHERSALENIFLVGVTLRKHIAPDDKKKADHGAVRKVVQGDMADPAGTSFGASLARFNHSDGISFAVPSAQGGPPATLICRGWLLLISADTPAAAECIGFKRAFSNKVKSPCWQCNASSAGLQQACTFLPRRTTCPFKLRTEKGYAAQRKHAESRPITKKRRAKGAPAPAPASCIHGKTCTCTRLQYMTAYGINTFKHAFEGIPHFSILNVPRDPMHVELEGNCKTHCYNFLHHCIIRKKWFTLAQLNAELCKHKLPSTSASESPKCLPQIPKITGTKGKKPKRSGTMQYTAAEMLHLMFSFTEILRPLIPAAAWGSLAVRAWLAHVQYVVAMMKPTFTEASIVELARLIETAQTLYLDPLLEYVWKPKNHFACHIPLDIQRFGPVRSFWCMRFEAKNQEHKRAAKLGAIRDAAKRIARFWVKRSYTRLRRGKTHKVGTIETGALLRVVAPGSEQHSAFELEDAVAIQFFNSLYYAGTHFIPGDWFLVCDDSNNLCLAQITDVVEHAGRFYAVMNVYDSDVLQYGSSDGLPSASEFLLSTPEAATPHMLFDVTAGGFKKLLSFLDANKLTRHFAEMW